MSRRTLAQWLELLEHRHPRAIDLGLARCGRVFARLGHPRPGARVVTVAGTNGKGSAVAWLDGLLGALGHSTAVYTSPHLLRFNERLVMDGETASDTALVEAFEAVDAARQEESLTYFEFTTLACLLLMQRAAPEFALLEVGLGGRLDTVNLVDADLALIMPIGLDHQEYLGPDRERIGAEKAGVLRAGRPVVCGESDPPISVLRVARNLGCPIYRPGREYRHEVIRGGVRFSMDGIEWLLPDPPLPGPHQPANLAAALAAVALLCPEAGNREAALRRGVAAVRLPGRLQRIPGDPRLLLDVGHNPMAAEAVARHLQAAGLQSCHCVLGMLRDKDAEGVAGALARVVEHWHCASLPGLRGQSGPALAARIAGCTKDAMIEAYASVGEALQSARQSAPSDRTILVFGSFETVGAALRIMADSNC